MHNFSFTLCHLQKIAKEKFKFLLKDIFFFHFKNCLHFLFPCQGNIDLLTNEGSFLAEILQVTLKREL